MKKINNKGMTSVEVLISFIVVVVISVSMYGTVTSYQNKQHIESSKEKIITYKNLITKEINDDLIMKGLVAVDYKINTTNHIITFTFKNGEKKNLIITDVKAADYDDDSVNASNDKDDLFIIAYGLVGDEMEYPLPNLGFTRNANNKKLYDLRISAVDVSTKDNIFSLYVGFSHPDLENRYFINIVCPINF